MSRLKIAIENEAVQTVERLYKDLERRIVASPPGICPVDLALNFLRLCHAQTCGKCVPCRIGLGQLATYLEDVLDGRATMATLGEIERLAKDIEISADCAIGTETNTSPISRRATAPTTSTSPCPAWRCARQVWIFRATSRSSAKGAAPTRCA